MEAFSALLALCAGKSPVSGEFPSQRPVTRMFSLICARLNGWVNNREAGDLRRHRAHYDDIVMYSMRGGRGGRGYISHRISSHFCYYLFRVGYNIVLIIAICFIVRRAGLLWSQQDFEWRWSVPLFKCLTVLEFSFILFDLCLLITFFNFIMNYVPIVTFWIFTYHKIWILSIMFCSLWSYWIIYFLACLEVSWRVVS